MEAVILICLIQINGEVIRLSGNRKYEIFRREISINRILNSLILIRLFVILHHILLRVVFFKDIPEVIVHFLLAELGFFSSRLVVRCFSVLTYFFPRVT